MKKVLLIKLLVCFYLIGYGQTIGIIVNDGQSKGLYDLYFNKIRISSDDVSCDSVGMYSSNLEIRREGCIFYVKMNKRAQKVSITMHKNGAGKIIKTFSLPVIDSIPKPVLRINGNKHRELGNNMLSERTDSVFCEPYFKDKHNREVRFHVVSFGVRVKIKGTPDLLESNSGNLFSSRVKASFLRFKPGDELQLSDVIVSDEAGNQYYIPLKIFKAEP